MFGSDAGAAVFLLVVYVLGVFALFWIIRLAVRYGMDDALNKNRSWLGARQTESRPQAPDAVQQERPKG